MPKARLLESEVSLRALTFHNLVFYVDVFCFTATAVRWRF